MNIPHFQPTDPFPHRILNILMANSLWVDFRLIDFYIDFQIFRFIHLEINLQSIDFHVYFQLIYFFIPILCQFFVNRYSCVNFWIYRFVYWFFFLQLIDVLYNFQLIYFHTFFRFQLIHLQSSYVFSRLNAFYGGNFSIFWLIFE